MSDEVTNEVPETAPEAVAPVDSSVVEGAEPEAAPLGLELGSTVAEEPKIRLPTKLRGKVQPDGSAIGTGRRKTAVARVTLRKGTGVVTVNGREFDEYFPVERHRLLIEAPLKAAGMQGQVDISVRASGGGVNG
ncbi:MAG: 30S ribosomal protein S9, partial [Planctomycetaceae bacterium]